METNNQNKTTHPEKNGKVPASGVMSETYKEEVNSQDELGSSSNHPQDAERSNEDELDSYPLEEVDRSEEKNLEREHTDNGLDDNERSINSSDAKDDEFLK